MKNHRGVVATFLTLGLVVIGTAITLGTSLFINSQKTNLASNSKAAKTTAKATTKKTTATAPSCKSGECAGASSCFGEGKGAGGSVCCGGLWKTGSSCTTKPLPLINTGSSGTGTVKPVANPVPPSQAGSGPQPIANPQPGTQTSNSCSGTGYTCRADHCLSNEVEDSKKCSNTSTPQCCKVTSATTSTTTSSTSTATNCPGTKYQSSAGKCYLLFGRPCTYQPTQCCDKEVTLSLCTTAGGTSSCSAGSYMALKDCESTCGSGNCKSCNVNSTTKYECKVSASGNLNSCKNARTFASTNNCKSECDKSCTQCTVDGTVRYECGGAGPAEVPVNNNEGKLGGPCRKATQYVPSQCDAGLTCNSSGGYNPTSPNGTCVEKSKNVATASNQICEKRLGYICPDGSTKFDYYKSTSSDCIGGSINEKNCYGTSVNSCSGKFSDLLTKYCNGGSSTTETQTCAQKTGDPKAYCKNALLVSAPCSSGFEKSAFTCTSGFPVLPSICCISSSTKPQQGTTTAKKSGKISVYNGRQNTLTNVRIVVTSDSVPPMVNTYNLGTIGKGGTASASYSNCTASTQSLGLFYHYNDGTNVVDNFLDYWQSALGTTCGGNYQFTVN